VYDVTVYVQLHSGVQLNFQQCNMINEFPTVQHDRCKFAMFPGGNMESSWAMYLFHMKSQVIIKILLVLFSSKTCTNLLFSYLL
jgi:hypothetical protein